MGVTGASSPSRDAEGSVCSNGALLAHVCMCAGSHSCTASMCGAVLCSGLGHVLHPLTACQVAPCPIAVPCTSGCAVLGECRGPGLSQAQVLPECKKDHRSATAVVSGTARHRCAGQGDCHVPPCSRHPWVVLALGLRQAGKRLLHMSGQCSMCGFMLGLVSASLGPGIRADRPSADGPQGDEHQVDEQDSRTAMT